MIARKPSTFTPEWAASPDEVFTLYTRTSTVNLINSANQGLIEFGWPFPAYVNLHNEQRRNKSARAVFAYGGSRVLYTIKVIFYALQCPSIFWTVFQGDMLKITDSESAEHFCDAGMVLIFRYHRKHFFSGLAKAEVLSSKCAMLKDIERAYANKMWAACITTTVPLLDHVMRQFFQTDKLNATIQVLRDAFINEAKLRPKDLMPGYSVWDGKKKPEEGNAFASTIEEDLRLAGIYLSSFFEFSDRYYAWYKSSDDQPLTPLNRHAVVHCSSEYWTEGNAVRMLTFLDLTIRLEPVLNILIHGDKSDADDVPTT